LQHYIFLANFFALILALFAIRYGLMERQNNMNTDDCEEIELITPATELFRRLLPVARSIFTATFAGRFDHAEFERFCDSVYEPGGSMLREFEVPDVRWQIAVV